MWIIKLAWKNLWRNRNRTLITVAAIFFAVILSTIAESLKQGVFENLVKNVVMLTIQNISKVSLNNIHKENCNFFTGIKSSEYSSAISK